MALEEALQDNNILKKIISRGIIGNGSFGKIWNCKLPNGGEIAIKRIKKEEIFKYGEDYIINSIFTELECMKKCECKNSVKFLKYYETRNNFNIIMELCDKDLAKELSNRAEGFKADEIKNIMLQLNEVFKKLEKNNIVHRDLKLENILIKYVDNSKTKFIPKLSDYGASKHLMQKYTKTKVGTIVTMAPEIMKNLPYNYKVDLWSIGVIIYQLHFKDSPYHGINEHEIFNNIINQTPYKQAKDPLLRDLINKLLTEDPEKRLSWEEYFNHPFFASKAKISTMPNSKNNQV